jgi:hypothetical protein
MIDRAEFPVQRNKTLNCLPITEAPLIEARMCGFDDSLMNKHTTPLAREGKAIRAKAANLKILPSGLYSRLLLG